MAGDNLQIFPVLAHHLGAFLGHKAVARTVEPVPTNAILLVILIRNAVKVVLRLYRVVERRVKHRHLRHPRQHFPHSLHTHDVARYVQRSQIGERTDLLQHIVRDEHTLLEILAAVGKPVTHSRHLLQRIYHTVLVVDQRLHHHP